MNILFFYNSTLDPLTGGIGRVSNVLAEYFESKGHRVFFLSKLQNGSYEDKRQYYLVDDKEYLSKENIEYFLEFLNKNKINILINQSAMSREASRLAYYANDLKIPVLSVIHNTLIGSIVNFSSAYNEKFKKFNIQKILTITDNRIVKNIILFMYKLKYKAHYNELCTNSNKVILLSKAFFSEIEFFTGSKYEHKLMAIPNPVSFDNNFENINFINKKKELLYVGVVNFTQKRVDLLLNIWKAVSPMHQDWNLNIIGGGIDLEKAKKMSSELNLRNITFAGFQDPQKYYKDASIFCMTSSYEGFGIVLVEAMQHGVVPIAFSSYLSIMDIIDTNKNGILVDPFDTKMYIRELSKLMENYEHRVDLAKSAIEKSEKFSIEVIGEKWEELLTDVEN